MKCVHWIGEWIFFKVIPSRSYSTVLNVSWGIHGACIGGDRKDASLGFYGNWAEFCCQGLRWSTTGREFGAVKNFSLLPDWQRNPTDFWIFQGDVWLRNVFFLYFLFLKIIGFGWYVCLLTSIRDGSHDPQDNFQFHFMFFMEIVSHHGLHTLSPCYVTGTTFGPYSIKYVNVLTHTLTEP